MEWTTIRYETGIEEPEILGSGTNRYNVFTSRSKEEAIEMSKIGGRNYLRRYTKTVIEEIANWNPITKDFD